MPRLSFPFSLACLIVLALPAHGQQLSERFAAKPAGKLTIQLERGSVAVYPHDAAEIRLEAHTRGVGASSLRLEARERDDEVLLVAQPEPWLALLQSRPGVRVRAWVPADYAVEVQGDGVEIESGLEQAPTHVRRPTRRRP